jgi:hypothetical protein
MTRLRAKIKVRDRTETNFCLWRPRKSISFKATLSNRGHLLIFKRDGKHWDLFTGFSGEVVLIWLLIDGKRSIEEIWKHCEGVIKLTLFDQLLADLQNLGLIH